MLVIETWVLKLLFFSFDRSISEVEEFVICLIGKEMHVNDDRFVSGKLYIYLCEYDNPDFNTEILLDGSYWIFVSI